MAKNKQQEKKTGLSLDAMVQEARARRKAEARAQEILGSNRGQNAPNTNSNNNNSNRKAQTTLGGGSLASRVGITKRSVSQPSLPTLGNKQQSRGGQKNNHNNNNNRRKSGQAQGGADGRLAAALNSVPEQSTQSFTFNKRAPVSNGRNDTEITIRGAAGPYCVVASNFAPGTTAADIESVMAPVGGEMAGCKLIASQPTVIAEMIFIDRAGADNVISMFNGKKADGRVLYVYFKEGGPSQPLTNATPARTASPAVVINEPVQEVAVEDSMMDVEPQYPSEPSPAPLPQQEPSPRPEYPRGPRDTSGRASYREDYGRDQRNEPGYQDGRYGFGQEPRYYEDRRPQGPRYQGQGGPPMYSDDMRGGYRRGGGGGGGRGRYR